MTIETQRQLLKRVVDQTGSNYTELAKALGVTRQAISNFRRGSQMGTATVLKLAKISKEDPLYVLACKLYNDESQVESPDEEILRFHENTARMHRQRKS